MNGQIFKDVAYNIKATNTRRIRAAAARNDENAIVACIGDSTTRGQSTGGGSTQALSAWPMQVAGLLDRKGVPAGANNLFGMGNGYNGAGSKFDALKAADPRISADTGSMLAFGVETAGGIAFAMNASAGFTFTPQAPVSHFKIYHAKNPGHGSFSYSINGGTPVTVSCAAPVAVGEVSIDVGSLGLHTLTLAHVSGNVAVLGMSGYNNTGGRKELTFLNLGISGAKSDGFLFEVSGQPYTRRPMQKALAPALSLIEGGIINDWGQSTTLATTKSNIKTLCQDMLISGDVILITPVFDGGTAGLAAYQESYVRLMYEIADELDIGLIDVRRLWLSYTQANADGYMSDPTHPGARGYREQAKLIARVLADVCG